MQNQISFAQNISVTLETLETLQECISVTLGPLGKTGILDVKPSGFQIVTNGSKLIKALEFQNPLKNTIVKLIEQAATKTSKFSGDGSTTTILFICHFLSSVLQLFSVGYNPYFLNNGIKKLIYFLMIKINEKAIPIRNSEDLASIMKTSLGQKISSSLQFVLEKALKEIGKDGTILIEENSGEENEIEKIQGIELEKGYASSYFVNDLKNFEVIYNNPYVLITTTPINTFTQLSNILEKIKKLNRPLVIIAEEIQKDVLSTLVLNTIQKKIKVVVIKYSSIKFLKTGILEDLALLTHSSLSLENNKNQKNNVIFHEDELGQIEKIVVKKTKTIFFFSKFGQVIFTRHVNELTRQLLLSDSEYEKSVLRTRIERFSGTLVKIKMGITNKYQEKELQEKIQNSLETIKAGIEEGLLGGGGSFYSSLPEEVENWGVLNLIGEEIFSAQIVSKILKKPMEELIKTSQPKFFAKIISNIEKQGYPFAYDILKKDIFNTLEIGLVDSAKSVRGILWNSLTLVSLMATSY
jgi:chaperonin GroEL